MSRPDTQQDDADPGSGDLLEELRVVLPGVQVLFGFLLTVPFSQRFTDLITPLRRYIYFGTLLCAAIATVLLIGPSVHRRIRRLGGEDRLGTRLTLAGTAFLALTVTGSIFVVADVLFGIVAAGAVAACLALATVGLWYGLPLARRARR